METRRREGDREALAVASARVHRGLLAVLDRSATDAFSDGSGRESGDLTTKGDRSNVQKILVGISDLGSGRGVLLSWEQGGCVAGRSDASTGGVVKFAPVALVALVACGGQLAQLPSQAATCAQGIVPSEGAAVLSQAYASLTSAPGAQSWADFSRGQLLSAGLNLGLCIIEAVVHDLDQKLPPTAVADASGHVMALTVRVDAGPVEGATCPVPTLLLAHDRAVDFLERHGVKHYHATPTPATAPPTVPPVPHG
jgi:hypothetical protein